MNSFFLPSLNHFVPMTFLTLFIYIFVNLNEIKILSMHCTVMLYPDLSFLESQYALAGFRMDPIKLANLANKNKTCWLFKRIKINDD